MIAVGHVDVCERGVSARAVRAVLRAYCELAQPAGSLRCDVTGPELAAHTHYHLSVIRRAQRCLIRAGYLEKIEGGSGHSTQWRVAVERLGQERAA